MKFFKLYSIILVVFFKTGNLLSDSSVFDVNNIEIENKGKASNEILANYAIERGFNIFLNRVLLKEDKKKLDEIKLSEIKKLVTYYQVLNNENNENNFKTKFNVSFDKDKIHDLFFSKNISYSEIKDKELFTLPILKKDDQIFIYNDNYFYEKWNEFYETDLIEFILPIENIEIIQKITLNSSNLLNIDLTELFKEYPNKNLALIFIEKNIPQKEKIYLISKINNKSIVKNIKLNKLELRDNNFDEEIIKEIKKELINLVKAQSLIDISAPSFLNAQLNIKKKNNLVELNLRLKKIDLIENVFIEDFNSEYVSLKIKYLGKLDNILRQLKDQNIILKFIGDEWSIKII